MARSVCWLRARKGESAVAPPRPPSGTDDRAVWAGEAGSVARTFASHHPPFAVRTPAPWLLAATGSNLCNLFEHLTQSTRETCKKKTRFEKLIITIYICTSLQFGHPLLSLHNKFENVHILPGRFCTHTNTTSNTQPPTPTKQQPTTDRNKISHLCWRSFPGTRKLDGKFQSIPLTTDDDGSVKAIAAHVHDQEWEKEVGSKREAMPPKSSQGLPAGSSLGTQPGVGEGAGQEKGGNAAEILQGAASGLDPHSNPTQTTSAAAKRHIQGLWQKVSISRFHSFCGFSFQDSPTVVDSLCIWLCAQALYAQMPSDN
jgi:hypothetical protein